MRIQTYACLFTINITIINLLSSVSVV